MPFVWTGAQQPILEKRRRERAESRLAELHFNPNPPMPSGGGWTIQVGAFKDPGLARAVAEGARRSLRHPPTNWRGERDKTVLPNGAVGCTARTAHFSTSGN